MKRTLAFWLGLSAAAGLLAFAILPAIAQTPPAATAAADASASTGKIHGFVTGAHNQSLAASGTVTLSPVGGQKGEYKFNISKTGAYTAEAPAGAYSVRVMMQDQNGAAEYNKADIQVTINAGQDVLQNIDLGNFVSVTSTFKGPSGTIHGRVIGPDGLPTPAGTVSLSLDGGPTAKFSFPVKTDGTYSGIAAPGKYTLVFRGPTTPPDKVVDQIDNIKIVVGQDVAQDDDMTRKEYFDKMTPDQKKQFEEIKKTNQALMKDNAVLMNINADLKTVVQDFSDAVTAKDAATKIAKYQDAETLMLRDTAAKPDASTLWEELGRAQVGLGTAQNDQKKYDEAIASLKKALDMETTAKKPNGAIQGLADSTMGEVYARTGKVPDANAAYDAAAKADPTRAISYLKNESVIFSQVGNSDASAAAADEAIKLDPKQAILYYLKAQGLVTKATVDPKTKAFVAPPGCIEAYQMYLQLAPDGAYAPDVKDVLASFGQKPLKK